MTQQNAQTSLFARSYAAMMQRDPGLKVVAVRSLRADWQAGRLALLDDGAVELVPVPGRPDRPELVRPRALKPRSLGTAEGVAAMLHAIAHIEFNAINLALDAAYRFRSMPTDYYADWLRVAEEEALHFELISRRLQDLGFAYGDFPAHNGLWEAAVATADDVTRRMALVPRLFEARGLDVTPGIIEKFRTIGDAESVAVLELVLREEIGHVAIGDRWFRWGCARQRLDPEATYRGWVREFMKGQVRGPFNAAARLQAGFTREELAALAQAAGQDAAGG